MDNLPMNRESYEMLKTSVLSEIDKLEHFAEKVQKLAKELTLISRNILYSIDNNAENEKLQKLQNSQKLAKEEKELILQKITKHFSLMAKNLNSLETERLYSKRATEVAIETYCKLLKLGYTEQLIAQSVQDACNDSFWSRQFRSYPKLLRKNKDGVFYIDVFLSLRQNSHKLSIPKVIR
jgi:hypothetical protein